MFGSRVKVISWQYSICFCLFGLRLKVIPYSYTVVWAKNKGNALAHIPFVWAWIKVIPYLKFSFFGIRLLAHILFLSGLRIRQ